MTNYCIEISKNDGKTWEAVDAFERGNESDFLYSESEDKLKRVNWDDQLALMAASHFEKPGVMVRLTKISYKEKT